MRLELGRAPHTSALSAVTAVGPPSLAAPGKTAFPSLCSANQSFSPRSRRPVPAVPFRKSRTGWVAKANARQARPGVLVAHEQLPQRETSSDSSGMTTVRLQRRHFSSTPSRTRRANKLPQAQRRSSCAQAPRGLEGTMRSSVREVRAGCVMDVLDERGSDTSAIESHYQ
jgi:hypothetical protein